MNNTVTQLSVRHKMVLRNMGFSKRVRRIILWMEMAQKHLQTYKTQDALKKRYALTLCACMIHAAKYNDRDINI